MSTSHHEAVARMSAREWLLATLGCTAAVAIGLAFPLWHRAFDVARNDDWVYLRAVERFVESGRLEPDPFSNAMGLGQVLIGAPAVTWMGAHFWVVHVVGAVLALVALVFAYATVREIVAPRSAAFVIILLALSPQFLPMVATFMSDLPAFALMMPTLWCGARAVRSGKVRLGWLAASMVLAFAAFSVRETAICAGLAVAAGAAWYCWRTRRPWVAPFLVVVAWLAALVVLYWWRLQQPSPSTSQFGLTLDAARLQQVGRTLPTFALMICPVLALLSRRVLDAIRTNPVASAVTVFATMLFLSWVSPSTDVLLGNYLRQTGVAAETVHGDAPLVMPSLLWRTLGVVAMLALVFAMLLVVDQVIRLVRARRLSPVEPDAGARAIFGLYAAGMVTLVMLLRLANTPLFDRYLFPAVPFVAALLLRGQMGQLRWRPGRVLGATALACWALLGVVYADASATFDGSKWRAAEVAVAHGIPANRVNGGYEWFGYWQDRTIEPREMEPEDDPDFWVHLFPDPGICAEVAFPKWKPWYLMERRVDDDGDIVFTGTYPPGVWDLIGTHTERTMLGMRYTYELRTTTPTCAPR